MTPEEIGARLDGGMKDRWTLVTIIMDILQTERGRLVDAVLNVQFDHENLDRMPSSCHQRVIEALEAVP